MKRFFTSYYQSRLNEWELVTCDAEMLRMMRAPASVVLAHESKRCKETVQQLECTVGLRVQIQDVAVKSLSWKDERHSGFRGRGTPDLWLPIRGSMTNRTWCTSILFFLWRYLNLITSDHIFLVSLPYGAGCETRRSRDPAGMWARTFFFFWYTLFTSNW
jgi:hypothetical protein